MQIKGISVAIVKRLYRDGREMNLDKELRPPIKKILWLLLNFLSTHNCRVRIAFEVADFDVSFQTVNDSHCVPISLWGVIDFIEQ